jgi:hypothetical protein
MMKPKIRKNNLLASLPAAPPPAQQAQMQNTVGDGGVLLRLKQALLI